MRWLHLSLFIVLWGMIYTSQGAEESCGPTHFLCTNGRCINIAWRCDGDDDCNDASDEENCPSTTCAEGFFRCNDGKCITNRWTCDGSGDCKDSSDEDPKLCVNKTCTGYKCRGSNECIPSDWKCDDQSDCPDGDDEAGCSVTCDPATEFECADKKCISIRWHCDSHDDCDDGSDEKDCPPENCDAVGQRRCGNDECINDMWFCDGENDCKDGSDEENCTFSADNQPCAANEFHCAFPLVEPMCIHMAWKCDGDVDCSDGSDEKDCAGATCQPSERACDEQYCIKAEFFCDGEEDCQNGADERDCNITVTDAPICRSDEFDCGDGKCVPAQVICNGHSDCDNNADEDYDRHCPALSKEKDTCQTNNGGCMQICIPDTEEENSRKCKCHEGFEMVNGSKTECEDVDECEIPGACSQICINTKGSYKCQCNEGYVLTNHRYCKAISGNHAQLILSDSHELRRYHLDTYHYSRLLENNVSGVVAMDFDIRTDYVFLTDVKFQKVYKANLKTNEMNAIIEKDILMPDGLAVDWIHRNLYLSDTGSNHIEVARLDGTNRKTLITEDLDEPRALVVDPQSGWIYWTDWGKTPKIEKCGMNGQQRKAIVTQGIMWPNGLTIDYLTKRLYWVDAKLHIIGSADVNGENFKLVLKSHKNLGHPFAITVFEDYLYWTDWISNAVNKFSKFGTGEVSTIALDLKTPMDIHVYHIFRQPDSVNACGANNGGCSHLCLPKPVIGNESLEAECACPNGMELADQHTCKQSAVAVTTKSPPSSTDLTNPNRPPQTPKPVTQKPSTEGQASENPAVLETTEKSVPKEETTGTAVNNTQEHVGSKEEEGVGHIAGIAIAVVLVVAIVVGLVILFLVKRHKSRNVKSMNFDNPVYRKTTTDDQLIMNGSRSNLPQSMQPLNQENDIV